MTNQRETSNRSLLWDDEPPAQIRVRRTREDSSPGAEYRPATAARRGGPGMPLEFDDPDGDGELHPVRERYGAKRGRWWRPVTRAGRMFLAVSALVALGTLTTAGLILKSYLERDVRFRIAGTENIQATGLAEVSRAQMLPVFGEDIGRNIFFVPLNERRKQLEQIPWIERATVMRLLPDQIRVGVVERTPVAFTRHGHQIGLVDANGVLLDMPASAYPKHHYSFPVVTGIDSGDSAAARMARMAMYLRLMAELDAGGKHNSDQISEIDLTDPEDARVLMPAEGTDILAHFGEDHFLERYQRYQAHIAEWHAQYPHLKAVDLRYEQQVVLEMASGKEASEAAGSDPAATGAKADGATATGAKDAKPMSEAGTKPRSSALSGKKNKAAQDKKHAAPKHAASNAGGRNGVPPKHTSHAQGG